MKSRKLEYLENPEKYLDEQVEQYFLKKYPKETLQESKLLRRVERANVRKIMKSNHETKSKQKYAKSKDYCNAFEQHARIGGVAEPEAREKARAVEAMLMELTHNDALALSNEFAILKNQEERSGYVSFDRRAELKRELKEPIKMYETRLLAEIQEAFK